MSHQGLFIIQPYYAVKSAILLKTWSKKIQFYRMIVFSVHAKVKNTETAILVKKEKTVSLTPTCLAKNPGQADEEHHTPDIQHASYLENKKTLCSVNRMHASRSFKHLSCLVFGLIQLFWSLCQPVKSHARPHSRSQRIAVTHDGYGSKSVPPCFEFESTEFFSIKIRLSTSNTSNFYHIFLFMKVFF